MDKFFDKLNELIGDNEKLKGFPGENKDMIIKVAAAALLVVAAFFIFVFAGKDDDKKFSEEAIAVEASEPIESKILVDIGGEVVSPMVAELEEGARVEDAIKAAGGTTDNADLTEINRAAFVEDGEKIYIPPKVQAEGASNGYNEVTAAVYSDGKVNINTAGSEELQELDGVGPVTAEKIIDYRSQNGRFKTIQDIKNVSGIGDKTFEKFKDDIKV